jgi:NAD-dependent SIR2 family protein deacetylase
MENLTENEISKKVGAVWTSGKPFIVTRYHIAFPWSGKLNNFRCELCGHMFEVGDVARWQYTNDTPGAGGNPFVCEKCDGTKEEIVAKQRELLSFKKRMGW